MKLSFVLVTKNSEQIVGRLLDSVANLCDEVIVIDNNSDDRTVDEVKKYTSKIFSSKESGRYFLSKLRNLGKSKALGDWILSLDSDEILSNEAVRIIPSLIRDDNYDGYWFRRRNYLTSNFYLKYGYFYPDYQLSLFKNRKQYQYSLELHTRINLPENKTRKVDVDILHYSQYSKYNSIRNLINFRKYIISDAIDILDKKSTIPNMLVKGICFFFVYFFNGFFRGKGFLDGYSGFVANFNFSSYISLPYFVAVYSKLLRNKLDI